LEDFSDPFRGEILQRRETFSAHGLGQFLRGFFSKPQTQLTQRRVQRLPQRQQGRCSGGSPVSFPNHVQNHVVERRVAVVRMGVPAAGSQIDLDIAGLGRFISELNYRPAKIRASFGVPKTRMQYPDGQAIRPAKLFAQQSLMLPDGLEQVFGR
jgi:hypothetical protein